MFKRCSKIVSVLVLTFLTIFSLISLNEYFMKRLYPTKYDYFIEKFSKKYKVRKTLIYAVIKTESDFDKNAKSKSNALGIMQITGETFGWLLDFEARNSKNNKIKKYKKLKIDDLFDPEINIEYGTYFISILLSKYKDEKTALAAYNAGMGRVDYWLKNKSFSEDGITLIKIPFKETEDYVQKVFKSEEVYKNLYSKNELSCYNARVERS